MNAFLRAYIECALWSSNDESTEQGGEPFDRNYSEADLAPETLAKMTEECERFERENAENLALVPGPKGNWSAEEQSGHDFWLTRNRHGAGFWDRGYGAIDEALTDAAQGFGEVSLYLGDDGRIYQS